MDTTTGEFDDLANEYGLTKQEIVEAAKNDPSLYSLLMDVQRPAAAVDSRRFTRVCSYGGDGCPGAEGRYKRGSSQECRALPHPCAELADGIPRAAE